MVVTPAPYLSISVSEALALPTPAPPEDVNHHTFTSLLDHRARDQPSRLAVGFPQPDEQTCQTFTYHELARGSKRLAAKLRDVLQTRCDANRQPIISLLGPSGPDFLMTILACWHLGAAVLPIALGTPALGAAKLLQACQCSILLHCSSQTQLAEEIGSCESNDKHLLRQTWLGAGDEECHAELHGPLFEASPEDTLVIFHSSGSSGMPKPLVQLHKFWSNSLLTAPGRDDAAFTTTPLFHGGLSDFFRSVQAAAPLFFFPWHLRLAPTINNIIQSANGCGQEIRYFLSVPFILEMLIADEQGTAFLRAMELVSTGGAPLSGAVGDRAVTEEDIKLVSRLGSSECGFLMSSFRDFGNDKDWSWLRIPDKLGQGLLRFERVGDSSEEVFELVVSAQWPAKRLSNRGDGSFATGDLFERHPDLANRWRYKRRGDDSIVMINGKKVNGALVESLLRSSPLVEDAIVFGANRPLLGAIVFPSTDEYRQPSFLADFSTLLKSFVASLPSHGRLPLEMVHFGDASLYVSLPRSSKGTLQKGLALNKLDDLIDNVYDRFMEGDAPSAEAKKMLDGQELTEWLKSLIEDICDRSFDLEDDFYRSGVDSIMAARIRAGVHQGLELQGFRLESNDIYDHPTINQLSTFIQSKGDQNTVERADVMQEMVKKYSNRLVPPVHSIKPKPRGSKVILLTGATGALGCRVLHELLQGSAKSGKIICLVRAKDLETARRRVVTAMHERGLTLEERMVIFITDLQDPAFQREVSQAASFSIIHCAWIVNFKLRVESFEEDCIAGLTTLLNFFTSRSNAHRFIFCSSLASIMSGPSPHEEKACLASADSGSTGYGNSKWIAEQICRQAGCNVLIARVGQLCGDTERGSWNTSEAWPLMVRTAQEIGLLPDSGPDIDWLPVDIAALALVDLHTVSEVQSQYFHIALPPTAKRPSWSTFLGWLKDSGLSFQTESKAEWLRKVKENKGRIRGSALIEIWASIPESSSSEDRVEVVEATNASQTLRSANAVDSVLCKKMIDSWRAWEFLV